MTAQKLTLEKTSFEFPISLPSQSLAVVKKGESVVENQVIARIKKEEEKKINLVKALKVKRKKAVEVLAKKLGEEVKAGELVAQRKTLLASEKVESPIEGSLDSLSEEGILTIKSLFESEIRTEFGGEVFKVSKEEIIIRFPALKVNGYWGIGGRASGWLRIISQDSKNGDIFGIQAEILGGILLTGSEMTKAFWFKALSLGAAGIVCGSSFQEGFKEFLIKQQEAIKEEKEKSFLPPLILLSDREISNETWQELKKQVGKKTLIKGKKACLVIAL
jgi:hypothetical protein